ncbi:Uncharacterized protein SCF082_LOCUS13144 [Durusdinium trenchii]|uniref:Uncharacterized protein n=1 Tax=Durusdinium trenchii TaxID=1381693 RepID=A0ABP0JQP4_9DINO
MLCCFVLSVQHPGNPIQHGFARTFCDLHCIRDAVRKGDDAILRALEEAVEIIGKNTQLLLEHYAIALMEPLPWSWKSCRALWQSSQRGLDHLDQFGNEWFGDVFEKQVEEEASEEAMQEFDTMWWDMRRELDSYLGASLDYVHATTAAAQMLRDYSAHCKAGFAELKRSYSHSERAEKKAHRALKKAWTAVTSSLGEMASKVVDGAMFDHLALHDIHSLRLQKSEIKSFCSRSNETFALQLAADALQKGLFGQTQQQLAELAMLQHRFVSGGLGEAPDLNLVMDAKSPRSDFSQAA